MRVFTVSDIGSVSHFSAIWTGIRTEAEVNKWERGALEPTDTEVNVEEWGMAFSAPNPFGQPLRLDVWCMWTTCSSYGPLLFMLYQTVLRVITSGYLVLCGHSYNPGQNYLRIFTPPCTLCNTTTLFQKQLICGTKFPFPQVNVVSYKCLRIRVASEHTTTLLPRGGGREDAVQREC